ncbi:helix-turn-helix transcriptional regulator [Sedimenticola sp.]|uniref:helix-turn-helix transcriptional regulator n=1 Tax=Sedimenticola sp. TaxID=1940285 RepID=UPI003D14024A
MSQQLLNTTEAARFLGVSKAFLERDRWAGARIPFVKVGSRAVRYRQADLDTYIEQATRSSTSDRG